MFLFSPSPTKYHELIPTSFPTDEDFEEFGLFQSSTSGWASLPFIRTEGFTKSEEAFEEDENLEDLSDEERELRFMGIVPKKRFSFRDISAAIRNAGTKLAKAAHIRKDSKVENSTAKHGLKYHLKRVFTHPKKETRILKEKLKAKAFGFSERRTTKACFPPAGTGYVSKPRNKQKVLDIHAEKIETIGSNFEGCWKEIRILTAKGPEKPPYFKKLDTFLETELNSSSTKWDTVRSTVGSFAQKFGQSDDDLCANFHRMLKFLSRRKQSIEMGGSVASSAGTLLQDTLKYLDECQNTHREKLVVVGGKHIFLRNQITQIYLELSALARRHAAFRKRVISRISAGHSFDAASTKKLETQLKQVNHMGSLISSCDSDVTTLYNQTCRRIQILRDVNTQMDAFYRCFNEHQKYFSQKLNYECPEPKGTYDFAFYSAAVESHYEHFATSIESTQRLHSLLLSEVRDLCSILASE
ncbi:uncharacterized protein CXQ87_001370 [Candidozyma duobushaemuli]|uniref:Uncharacterized protein n=1 Tax=Candidozyma duobushaemuli TaxID=1231522 RepID=A0A2V1AMI3_9ASCO|nr:uncharacterized protein CXQ87_001370 [[Candida] duobushaemulonis]PVH18443.1 hypothetical protein CXQ87_001370 [[Candida] duobushaemulonis]